MTDLNKEFEYQLKYPFEYAGKQGLMEEASSILVPCPSNKVLRQLSIIESEFMNSLQKAQKETTQFNADEIKQNQDSSKEIKGSDATMAITAFGDINNCYIQLKEILERTALVDGTVKFTKVMWDELSPSDTKALLGEYIVNFIFSSLGI